jgi:signal transduction histidine kinase
VRVVVHDVVASCAELDDASGVEFAVDVPSDLPLVVADPDALRRAVGNLITNALKYGAAGRWVGVTALVSPSRAREVQIAVSDRGPGIDADDAAHLFEPFYRGRRAVERQIHGNGLGLSLVKRIVETHGGRVSVSSTPGEGATFTLYLPAANAVPATQLLTDAAADTGGSVA